MAERSYTRSVPDVFTRPRRDADIPALIDILARQQAETQYPFRWPPHHSPECFLCRPSELEAWVAEMEGAVVGHVAIQFVGDGALGQLWAGAHRVPVARLRCISVLFADRRLPRRGIGSTLLECATQRALADGGAPVLDVVAGRHEPLNLYRSRGWREVGRFRTEWLPADAEPLHVMILPRPADPVARISGPAATPATRVRSGVAPLPD